MLAKPHRAGELMAVRVPDAAHEAMRDLARARATAVRALARRVSICKVSSDGMGVFMPARKAGHRPTGVGSPRCVSITPLEQIVLQDYIHAVTGAEARVEAADQAD